MLEKILVVPGKSGHLQQILSLKIGLFGITYVDRHIFFNTTIALRFTVPQKIMHVSDPDINHLAQNAGE